MIEETEQELIPFKYVIVGVVVLVIASLVTLRISTISNYSWLLDVSFMGFTMAYVAGLATPGFYNLFIESRMLNKITIRRNSKHNLETKDVIQIDATVIAGALILLTLLHTSEMPNSPSESISNNISNTSLEIGGNFAHLVHMDPNRLIASMAGTIVIVFAFSALSAAVFKYIQIGQRLMVGGFVYEFIALVILTY